MADEAQAQAALATATSVAGVFLVGSDGAWFAGGQLLALEHSASEPVVVADEEGGQVMRIATEYGPIPSAHTMAATMTPAQVEILSYQRGLDMGRLGLNMDLAPDADLYNPSSTVIGDRSWSSNPRTVITYAAAFEAGLHRAGIAATIKHFPGHGNSTGDSHAGVVYTPPYSYMLTHDLLPFDALAPTTDAVMVGHLDVPGLTDPGLPASLSPVVMRHATQQDQQLRDDR